MSLQLRIDWRNVRWELTLPLDDDGLALPLFTYDQVEMAWWQPSGLPLDQRDICCILESCDQLELDAVLLYHLQTGHQCNTPTCWTPSLVVTSRGPTPTTSSPSVDPPSDPAHGPSLPF